MNAYSVIKADYIMKNNAEGKHGPTPVCLSDIEVPLNGNTLSCQNLSVMKQIYFFFPALNGILGRSHIIMKLI